MGSETQLTKSPVYTSMCYSSSTGKRDNKAKASRTIPQMPGTRCPSTTPVSASWEIDFFDIMNLCTCQYERRIWWNGCVMTELSFFLLTYQIKGCIAGITHFCHVFTVSCFPQIYIAKSGSCNSARLATINKDNESTLGSKENGYLIKATGKLPFLRQPADRWAPALSLSSFLKSLSGDGVGNVE